MKEVVKEVGEMGREVGEVGELMWKVGERIPADLPDVGGEGGEGVALGETVWGEWAGQGRAGAEGPAPWLPPWLQGEAASSLRPLDSSSVNCSFAN